MPFLLLHLMLRHGVDYLADAILDGIAAAARWCTRSPGEYARRVVQAWRPLPARRPQPGHA